MNAPARTRAAEELVRRLAASLRSAQLYAPGHPLAARPIAALADTLAAGHAADITLTVGIVGDELVVGDVPVPRAAETMGELLRRMQQAGVERIVLERGVTVEELTHLVQVVARADGTRDPSAALGPLLHVRVGRLQVERRTAAGAGDVATFQRLFAEAVAVAGTLWESARLEGKPDAGAARGVVDQLAQAVAQNRTALMALTALKNYDNYTFTHMVNVSILTMGQARGLGIEGRLLREFGLAGLMHDIGKVNTPTAILNKPDRLTESEFAILRRHTVDGAEILRRTPDIPTLAPVVAFEHHLRLDGTGYPAGVRRPQLNLATMLCGIADVYDAMRSQRIYQDAFPSDRILAVLQRNDGTQFDPHLVRRFAQLVGIYPAGALVRLDSGDIAVVTRIHASDPYRPRVRVVADAGGETIARPYDVNLWQTGAHQPASVRQPLDPAHYGIDPLSHLS